VTTFSTNTLEGCTKIPSGKPLENGKSWKGKSILHLPIPTITSPSQDLQQVLDALTLINTAGCSAKRHESNAEIDHVDVNLIISSKIYLMHIMHNCHGKK